MTNTNDKTTYSNPRRVAVIENWPYGRLRTTAKFEVETDEKRGERAVRTTVDPKTNKLTTPKKLTFAKRVVIVDGDDERTYIAELTAYGHVSIMNGDMKFQHESIHENDPRYGAALELFA